MKWLRRYFRQRGRALHMAGAALPHPDCRRRFTEEAARPHTLHRAGRRLR